MAMNRPTDPPRPVLDARLRRSLVGVVLSGAVLSAGALLVLGVREAVSVAAGAAIAAGNLWILSRIVAALLGASEPRQGSTRTAGLWAAIALLKMFGLFALVWLLMRYEVVSPLWMVVGFAALPAGIAFGAVASDRASSSNE
jgi:hypothetical protein